MGQLIAFPSRSATVTKTGGFDPYDMADVPTETVDQFILRCGMLGPHRIKEAVSIRRAAAYKLWPEFQAFLGLSG